MRKAGRGRAAAFLLLVASGMVQLMRGQIAGPALSLFSQALTLAVLHGKAADRFAALGATTAHVSLTHGRDTAAAVVVLER